MDNFWEAGEGDGATIRDYRIVGQAREPHGRLRGPVPPVLAGLGILYHIRPARSMLNGLDVLSVPLPKALPSRRAAIHEVAA